MNDWKAVGAFCLLSSTLRITYLYLAGHSYMSRQARKLQSRHDGVSCAIERQRFINVGVPRFIVVGGPTLPYRGFRPRPFSRSSGALEQLYRPRQLWGCNDTGFQIRTEPRSKALHMVRGWNAGLLAFDAGHDGRAT